MTPVSHVDGSKTDEMPDHSAERSNAASGYLVIALGIAGAAFERGSPPFTAPIEEVLAFWAMPLIRTLSRGRKYAT
jgi:hypothetical protein